MLGERKVCFSQGGDIQLYVVFYKSRQAAAGGGGGGRGTRGPLLFK